MMRRIRNVGNAVEQFLKFGCRDLVYALSPEGRKKVSVEQAAIVVLRGGFEFGVIRFRDLVPSFSHFCEGWNILRRVAYLFRHPWVEYARGKHGLSRFEHHFVFAVPLDLLHDGRAVRVYADGHSSAYHRIVSLRRCSRLICAVFKVRFALQTVKPCVNLRMDLIAQDGYSIRVEFSSCQGMVFVHASFLHRFWLMGSEGFRSLLQNGVLSSMRDSNSLSRGMSYWGS